MKYVKMLGLLAVAAAALMAFAGVASATTVTSPSGTAYTGTIKAERIGPKTLTLHGVVDVTCNKSTVEGSVSSHGAGVTAKGSITGLTFTECTQHVKVLPTEDEGGVKTFGTLEAHATSGGNGTLKSSGAEVTVEFTTIFGNVHCVFRTNNTEIGTLTGATSNEGHATLDIDSASIPVKSGSGLCGESAEWTGTYKATSPTGLKLS